MRSRRVRKKTTTRSPRTSQKSNLRLLEGSALVALVFVITGAFCISWMQKTLLLSGQSAAVITSVLVELANKDRADLELSPLTMSPVLTAAAQAKADDMASRGYFAHTTPDGKDSWYWFGQAGYAFLYAGENLAVDFSDSIDVERAWMNSPTHRANIVNRNYTEIGIAIATGTYKGHATVFVVQMFGTPSPKQAPITETSVPDEPREIATAAAISSDDREVLGENIRPLQEVAAPSASTESPLAPQITKESENPFTTLLTAPHQMLLYAYYALSVCILVALLVTINFEFKRHHIRHIAVASTLIVMIWGLFVFAGTALFPEPLVAMDEPINTHAEFHQ